MQILHPLCSYRRAAGINFNLSDVDLALLDLEVTWRRNRYHLVLGPADRQPGLWSTKDVMEDYPETRLWSEQIMRL